MMMWLLIQGEFQNLNLNFFFPKNIVGLPRGDDADLEQERPDQDRCEGRELDDGCRPQPGPFPDPNPGLPGMWTFWCFDQFFGTCSWPYVCCIGEDGQGYCCWQFDGVGPKPQVLKWAPGP